jgi:hypothetical protein
MFVAKRRQERNDLAGVPDRRRDDSKSSLDLHIEGYGGEMAFCKHHNIFPDFKTTPQKGGHDCILCGFLFDVKAVAPGRNMAATSNKESETSQFYALVICEWPKYTIVGFTSAGRLLVPERLKVLKKGCPASYFMYASELTPFPASNLRSILAAHR